ncbi:MAG: hypothetical protein R2734_05335 [Nocardioides sp.]
MSHELRTPLTTVRMASDVLHDARSASTPRPRGPRSCADRAGPFRDAAVGPAGESRFDAGAAVLELDDVNLVDVAHRVVASAQLFLADQRGTRVLVRAPRPSLSASPGRRTPGRADPAQPGDQRH